MARQQTGAQPGRARGSHCNHTHRMQPVAEVHMLLRVEATLLRPPCAVCVCHLPCTSAFCRALHTAEGEMGHGASSAPPGALVVGAPVQQSYLSTALHLQRGRWGTAPAARLREPWWCMQTSWSTLGRRPPATSSGEPAFRLTFRVVGSLVACTRCSRLGQTSAGNIQPNRLRADA